MVSDLPVPEGPMRAPQENDLRAMVRVRNALSVRGVNTRRV